MTKEQLSERSGSMENGASSYRRFFDGDDNSFVDIIRDYKDGLILYLSTFVGNILIAEDLAEDTFIKLVTRRPRFTGSSSFKTWLYAIGRNVAIDYIRHNSKNTDISIEDCENLIDNVEQFEREYIKEESRIIIHKVIGRLKKEYQQVLWLIYFEELSNKEAARIMKKSVHSIENLVYRARLSLKSELEKEGFLNEEL
jgi:RNA polymerase sigma-70 factor (ECF subfamily)